MPDGKLHIKGTLIIKGSKEDKEDKGKKSKSKKGKKEISIKGLKQRKPRKQKVVPSGTAYTGYSFGQQATAPYTAQALMTAMALRPPPPQITYMEQPQQKPSLEQPYRFQELLDNPNVPFDVPVVTTKKELLLKAEPFLTKEIQQNVQKYRQSLEQDTRAYEQRAMEAEQQAEERILGMRQELEQRQQFFENELEQSRDNYIAELDRMEMASRNEKEKMKLELLNEKARTDASIVMENLLGKIELNAEKEKSRQEIEQIKKKSEIEKKKAEIEKINGLSKATLITILGKESPEFNIEGLPIEQLKVELARVRRLPVRLLSPEGVRGRPTYKLQYDETQDVQDVVQRTRPKETTEQVLEPAQLSANDLLMQRMREKLQQAEEEQLNSDWLGFMSKKQQVEQKLETLPREQESSIGRALPNYLRTPFGVMTEERARQEFRNIPRSKGRQAEALVLAGTEFLPKKQDFTV